MGWEYVAILSLCVGAINQIVPVILAIIEKDNTDS